MSVEMTTETMPTKKVPKPMSPWRLSLRRLFKNKLAMGGLFVLVFMILLCFVGPYFSSHVNDMSNVARGNKPPNATNWLGTDKLGRDIFTRVMLAGRISLSVGIVAMLVSVTIGSIFGAVAGYYGKWVDTIMMRFTDILMCIPTLPLLIILGSILGDLKIPPSTRIYYVMLLIGLLSWPGLARLVRGQVLSLRELEYMQAAEALGLRDKRKIFRHLLPNTLPTIIVVATLTVASSVLSETVLSYLGLGVIPPTPSWGNLISEANNIIVLQKRPWLWVPPGVAIFLTVIAINTLGDGLRDAFDPKMKK
ncbi:oligopeptide ABC transporter permease [Gorillibacterium sp. CAU 1737]|uniref:oligopeptide ABC transporter permease n=1 Tax=Gorillibacterium sp. CAU 1737 TaxID=3140362 RepID=UPI00326194EA